MDRFTVDDMIFSILHSCVDGLRSDRLVYYLYAFQKAGLKLRYRYRVQTNGITCRDIVHALNTIIAHHQVECVDGVLRLTSEGYLYYDNVLMTLTEWDKVWGVKHILDSLSEEELFFVCVTDIVVHDMLQRSGVDGLVKGRSTIEQMLQTLSGEFTTDNFDAALKLLREIKEGALVWPTINE